MRGVALVALVLLAGCSQPPTVEDPWEEPAFVAVGPCYDGDCTASLEHDLGAALEAYFPERDCRNIEFRLAPGLYLDSVTLWSNMMLTCEPGAYLEVVPGDAFKLYIGGAEHRTENVNVRSCSVRADNPYDWSKEFMP